MADKKIPPPGCRGKAVEGNRPYLGPGVSRPEKPLETESKTDNSGSMKTTIDLPESEMKEALRHTGAKTKTEAVSLAVADYNRRQRLARLAGKMGTFKDLLTRQDLARMRTTD